MQKILFIHNSSLSQNLHISQHHLQQQQKQQCCLLQSLEQMPSIMLAVKAGGKEIKRRVKIATNFVNIFNYKQHLIEN